MDIEEWIAQSHEEVYVSFWRNNDGYPDPTAGAAMDRYFWDCFKEQARKKIQLELKQAATP